MSNNSAGRLPTTCPICGRTYVYHNRMKLPGHFYGDCGGGMDTHLRGCARRHPDRVTITETQARVGEAGYFHYTFRNQTAYEVRWLPGQLPRGWERDERGRWRRASGNREED